MADRDALVAQGFQNFNQGLGEGLQKFVQNKRESEFLDGAFEMLVSQRKQMGMQVDPNVLQKFSSGGLGSRRAIVSQLGAENQFAMKSAQESALARQKAMSDLQNDILMERVKTQMKQDENAGSIELLRKQYPDWQIPDSADPNLVVSIANAKKTAELRERQIDEFASELEAEGRHEDAARLRTKLGSGGQVMELTMPDGTVLRTGPQSALGEQSGVSKPTITKAEQLLQNVEGMAGRLGEALAGVDASTSGLAGILNNFKNMAAGQAPGTEEMFDQKVSDIQDVLSQLKIDNVAVNQVFSGNLNKQELEQITSLVPDAKEGAPKQISKLLKLRDYINQKARAAAKTLGKPIPEYAMTIDELTQSLEGKNLEEALRKYHPFAYRQYIDYISRQGALPPPVEIPDAPPAPMIE